MARDTVPLRRGRWPLPQRIGAVRAAQGKRPLPKAKGRKHCCFRPFLYSLVGRE
ncbi:protein of unknown function [Cupriavidus taiwanensis]|uniref:Uncharacterized protein n=1 Tax=Cupriavidus taiwanensis TaxID=164546 RepID=A0A9Q7XTG8_9BURK|nr:protein of unknown function [Cupriavidus taiwanensis]